MSAGVMARRPARALWLWDLTVQLVIRDLKVRYRRTIVGLAWSFAFPLGQILVFTFIFTLVLPARVNRYSAFVSVGVLVWTWFQSSLVGAATAITGNRELVRRPGFPSTVLPISTVATYFVLFLMALPALIGVVIYTGGHIGVGLVALPAVLAVQFMLTLGLSYFVASLNVTFRDTQQMVTLLLLLLFFLTPIFYDVASVPSAYRALYVLNPFVPLLDGYRSTIIQGDIPDPFGLAVVAVGSIVLWLAGRVVFQLASHKFAEEI